jgi:hypothetical protein
MSPSTYLTEVSLRRCLLQISYHLQRFGAHICFISDISLPQITITNHQDPRTVVKASPVDGIIIKYVQRKQPNRSNSKLKKKDKVVEEEHPQSIHPHFHQLNQSSPERSYYDKTSKHQTITKRAFRCRIFHNMYPNNPLNKRANPLFFSLSSHVMCCQTPNQSRIMLSLMHKIPLQLHTFISKKFRMKKVPEMRRRKIVFRCLTGWSSCSSNPPTLLSAERVRTVCLPQVVIS